MDFSRPTALEERWKKRGEEADAASARIETRLSVVLDALKFDQPMQALDEGLRRLSGPIHDLHSEYGERIVPLFGRIVQRHIGERAAVTQLAETDGKESLQGRLDLLKEKMQRVIGYFEVQAKDKAVTLGRTDQIEAFTFLISGPNPEKYYPAIAASRYDSKFSDEFKRRDVEIRGVLTDAICSNEVMLSATDGRDATFNATPERRFRILDEAVRLVTAAYGVPKPEIYLVKSDEMTPKGNSGAFLVQPYEIVANADFKTPDENQIAPFTFMMGIRLARHAIQAYLVKSDAFHRNDGTLVEPHYQHELTEIGKAFPIDVRALGLAFHTRRLKDTPPATEILYTTSAPSLLDRDAIEFTESLRDNVLQKLDPEPEKG